MSLNRVHDIDEHVTYAVRFFTEIGVMSNEGTFDASGEQAEPQARRARCASS